MVTTQYVNKKERLQANLHRLQACSVDTVALRKKTSNLLRHRQVAAHRIDVREFNQVIIVDPIANIAVVEGMTRFDALVQATLVHQRLPAVVPELKSITVGGALAGIGIESSSFRYGLVHETVIEFDVLLSNGEVVTCRADNEYRELFFAFPNSYGTLGYALRVVVKLIPAQKYVQLQHRIFATPEEFYQALKNACVQGKSDYVDGSIFSPQQMVLSVGQFAQQAPYMSDYKYMKIYYRSLLARQEDFVTASDYIWRWDPDWFWCSKVFGLQNPVLRFLFGKFMLRSTVYSKLMRFAKRNALLNKLQQRFARSTESVIQDVAIPIEHAAEFLRFFQENIPIAPLWNCPVMAHAYYPFFALEPGRLYVNFGFWDVVPSAAEEGYYNKLIEKKVIELSGIKSLYSNCYYTEEGFWKIYDRAHYENLKKQYDPQWLFGDLYSKCTEKQ